MPPPHSERAYFEFIVRHDPQRLPLATDTLVKALQTEGCRVTAPRYPLLHQQPFFTEGHFRQVARLAPDRPCPTYAPDALPRTAAADRFLLRLPACHTATRAILDQYPLACAKVADHAAEIGASA